MIMTARRMPAAVIPASIDVPPLGNRNQWFCRPIRIAPNNKVPTIESSTMRGQFRPDFSLLMVFGVSASPQCLHLFAIAKTSSAQAGHLIVPGPAPNARRSPTGPSRHPMRNHMNPSAPRPLAMNEAPIAQTTHSRARGIICASYQWKGTEGELKRNSRARITRSDLARLPSRAVAQAAVWLHRAEIDGNTGRFAFPVYICVHVPWRPASAEGE
jgi:hypothetical protein